MSTEGFMPMLDNVVICDLKGRMPKTLNKLLKDKHVIYTDLTNYTDLCDDKIIAEMNDLKHEIKCKYCEFYGVETDDELKDCIKESLEEEDEEFKELRNEINVMSKNRFKNNYILSKFKNVKLPILKDFVKLNLMKNKTIVKNDIKNVIETYAATSTIIILLTNKSVSKHISNQLLNYKLPKNTCVVVCKNDCLSGVLAQFCGKIGEFDDKFDVFMV